MEIQFWGVVCTVCWGRGFLGEVSFGNSISGYRMRSGYLSLILIGNSVLGSYAVGVFIPDFDWKFSFGCRVGSGFLSLILIGNSVLGTAVQLGRRFPGGTG